MPTWPTDARPPLAPIKTVYRTIHGDRVADDYYWMIDYFRKNPGSGEVLEYLQAENDYTTAILQNHTELRNALVAEMKARIVEEDQSVPLPRNGYLYYRRMVTGQQYFKYCRRKDSPGAPEEILCDVDEMAKGHAFYEATGFMPSDDGRLLAFGVDTASRRQFVIHIKDLDTGEILPHTIADTTGRAVWAADNRTLFYVSTNPQTLLSEKIKKFTISEDVEQTVYEEKDNTNYIRVTRSRSGSHIVIHSEATLSSELRLLPATVPAGAFSIFQPRMNEVLYEAHPLADRYLILTNDGAVNFRLMQCPKERTGREHWTELLPHDPDVLLEELIEYECFAVVVERASGQLRVRVIDLADNSTHFVDFGDRPCRVSVSNEMPFTSTLLRYVYSSPVTPDAVYDYDMTTRTATKMKQAEVPGYNEDAYTTQRLHAPADDGAGIPVSIVYRKDWPRNGTAPLLLYGYGAYGHSLDTGFNRERLSLLDRGFAFAIAHVRGGQELGRPWYDGGRMLNKKNTFTDFIAAARFLIDGGYTSSAHLYAQGGSAGGLLVGAVCNMEPALWKGIIAQVPFVDVVNTMLDETIPLTTNEYDEWGNPNEEVYYRYMKSYSPYENIERTNYPHLLVTTALQDSQVQYFEAAKWVAKLRALKTGDNLLLLHTHMKSGHLGASGRIDHLWDVSLVYTFLLMLEE